MRFRRANLAIVIATQNKILLVLYIHYIYIYIYMYYNNTFLEGLAGPLLTN